MLDGLKKKIEEWKTHRPSPEAVKKAIAEGQIWKSVFRHGYPDTPRNRIMAVLSNVFLHLHPVKARHSGIKMSYTWCMGGLSFFLFLNLTVTGVLLMFYYRPTAEYAYYDIVALRGACAPGDHAGTPPVGGACHGHCRVAAYVQGFYDRFL